MAAWHGGGWIIRSAGSRWGRSIPDVMQVFVLIDNFINQPGKEFDSGTLG